MAVGVKVTVIVQVPLAGTLEQLLVWEKSPGLAPVSATPVTESVWPEALLVSVTVCGALLVPTVTVPKFRLVGEKETTVPTPVRETVCVLPDTPLLLSVIVTIPLFVPLLVGLNATRIVQFAAGATNDGEIGQLLVSTYCVLMVTLLMVRLPVPVLVSVTVWFELVVLITWVAKVRLVGTRDTTGVPPTPVPVSVTCCGLFAALSVIVTVPLKVPAVGGVKVTEIVQFFPAATLVPQVLVSPKFVLAAMLVMVRVALPVLVSVTVCAALVVPTLTLLKVKLAGKSWTAGAVVPMPVRLTVWGLPGALSVTDRVPLIVPDPEGVKVTEMVQLALTGTLDPQVFVSL